MGGLSGSPSAMRRSNRRRVSTSVWDPYDESARRMIVSEALSPCPVSDEPRRSERLPTTLLSRAFKGIYRKDGIVYSLSLHGAFLEMPFPIDTGTPIRVEIELPDGSIMLKAEVVTVRDAGEGQSDGPAGMGVAFQDVDDGVRARLERFLEAQENRFQV